MKASLQVWSENDAAPDARPRRQGRAKAGQGATDLSQSLKENLKRLKNVLKLPKARRWVYCEFFYSGVDQQLFLGDNEFSQCLRESFPNLKCRHLSRAEWRTIRRLIGKPRRCSQVGWMGLRIGRVTARLLAGVLRRGALGFGKQAQQGAADLRRDAGVDDGRYGGLADATAPSSGGGREDLRARAIAQGRHLRGHHRRRPARLLPHRVRQRGNDSRNDH
jgi:hypothetical protein